MNDIEKLVIKSGAKFVRTGKGDHVHYELNGVRVTVSRAKRQSFRAIKYRRAQIKRILAGTSPAY